MSVISVLIRVHGETPFLRNALESVLAQTIINQVEILLVLDRPSVESISVIKEYMKFEGVSRVESKRPGAVQALQEGLMHITSEFTAILDADDLMSVDRLEKQLIFLRENPEIMVVGSNILIINARNEIVSKKEFEQNPDIIWNYRFKMVPLANPATLFRTQEIQNLGGYREYYPYADDPDLWLRVLEVGAISNIPEYLTYYREHDNQLTWKNREKIILHGLAVKKSARNRASGKPDLSELYESVEEWGTKPLIKIRVRKILKEREMLEAISLAQSEKKMTLFIIYSGIFLLFNPRSFYIYARRKMTNYSK